MSATATALPPGEAGDNLRTGLASLALGAGFTFLLFLGVAHFETPAPAEAEPDLAEMRVVTVPPEAPPPRPVETTDVPASAVPFAGLEIGASESPVHISVVPPDLAALVPVDTIAPAARIEPARLYSEFKPRTELDTDFGRIFQPEEVDQRPIAVSRPKPAIPAVVRGVAKSLRVVVLVLIDTHGAVTSTRVLQSSGNKYFDEIIVGDIQKVWVFSPAMRHGRKVRCMVQQNVRVEWTTGNPFESR